MKKTVFSLAIIAAIGMVSCNKEEITEDFGSIVSEEDASIRLAESDFTITETEPLGDVVDHAYTSGVLEYEKDGELLARVDFSESDEDHAEVDKGDGEKEECDLKGDGPKGGKKGKGPKDSAKKVIVEPIVKTDDCDYIVAGIIKFLGKDGEWLATVDFGDGTCDDIATKITPDGEEEFIMKPKKD